MNFEDLQKTWQAQTAGARITIDADVLLKEVRRNQDHFCAIILWRDIREVGVALLLAVFFVYCGLRFHDWVPYVLTSACCGVGAFMGVDRVRQRRRQPAVNDSLKTCIESSLRQVNHQIWLLKNVLWWYLSPFAAGLGVAVGISIWRSRHTGVVVAGLSVYLLAVALLFWGVYWLNQYAVRKGLEPRRQELETLLASLQ
jgi:hypothetical protein